MNRTTVARSRELASLLVVGVLLAAAVAPAGAASVLPRHAADVASTTPAAQAALVVALAPAGTPTPAATGSGPAATPAQGRPPASPSDQPGGVQAPPATATLGCLDTPPGALAAPVVSHGSRAQKVVALTFDDGYGPVSTIKIMEILERFHVNATFFPTGRAIKLFPAVWREVVAAGFPIGDHTYDHAHLAGQCFASQVRDLLRQQLVAKDLLGIQPMPIMRPPYGSRDALTPFAAQAAGDGRVVLWDVDTRDWSGISAWAVYKRAIVGGNGSIVLMHTFSNATVGGLTRIIASYWKRGYTFVTVGQLFGIPGPVPYP